ncbi:MAG: peptidyl-prolyl cis-trans isomerase, partial [Proteobacteria bacterium]
MTRAASLLLLLSLLGGCARCGGTEAGGSSSGSAATPPAGLSPEDAKKVLATVGDRTITLGDYAGVLERLGPYERMRYQAPERRKELLDEMITVEL